MHIFEKSNMKIKEQITKNAMKNSMFFGTSILETFWMDFGWGSGSQNLGLDAKNLPK